MHCKICGKEISQHSKSGLCKSCVKIGKISTIETRNKIRSSMLGKIHSQSACRKIAISKIGKNLTQETRLKIGASKLGKTLSQKTRRKISISTSGKNHHNYGKTATLESKRKMRIARIKRIELDKFSGNQIQPNYNPVACQKIDAYGKKNGYIFQHAMNGGEYHIKELGYFVDGYDKEKNVVIEYYEKIHSKQVIEDFNREIEICNHLGCDFIILWEN